MDERSLSADCADGVTPLSAVVLLLHLQVSSLSQQEEVRALVEGQFMSRRLHAERLGYSIRKSFSPSLLSSVVFSYCPGSGPCSSGPIGDGQAGHVVCGQRVSLCFTCCVFAVEGSRVLATGGASSNREILQVSVVM